MQEHRRERINVEPKDWRFVYDQELATRAYLDYEKTGVLRLPEYYAQIPKQWEADVMQAGYLLQFQRDGITDE